VLSAQSTDVSVNRVMPELVRRWPNPAKMAVADPDAVEQAIGSLGMFRQKARHLIGLSKLLVERHEGQVPPHLADLIQLPGVGRKTANVVLGVAFGSPEGVVVDTHVQRLAQRLGFSEQDQPSAIEEDLMRLFPRNEWDILSHTLIFHGRRCCTARNPACGGCPVAEDCPSANRAAGVGRKSVSPRRST
jgi:endonuclease-3